MSSCSCVVPTAIASPALARRAGSPLKGSSPAGSPKSGGRKQGRLRLPQLGSRHRLSTSKENLESSSFNITSGSTDGMSSGSNKESSPDQDTSSVAEVEAGSGAGQEEGGNALDSWSEEASGSESEVVVMNGLVPEGGHANGHAETNTDAESALHQRDEICLQPVYNLYATSVGVIYPPLSNLSIFFSVLCYFHS